MSLAQHVAAKSREIMPIRSSPSSPKSTTATQLVPTTWQNSEIVEIVPYCSYIIPHQVQHHSVIIPSASSCFQAYLDCHHGQEAIHEAIHYSQKSLDELYSYLYSMGQNSAVTPSPSLPGSGWEILGNLGSPYDLDVMGTFAARRHGEWESSPYLYIFVPYFCPEQLWMPFTIFCGS